MLWWTAASCGRHSHCSDGSLSWVSHGNMSCVGVVWPTVPMLYHALVLCSFCRPIPVPKLEWGLKFQEIAKETNGFSGREISKLAIAWQVCVWRMLMYIHVAITCLSHVSMYYCWGAHLSNALSVAIHMTATWLSHDCHMTILSHVYTCRLGLTALRTGGWQRRCSVHVWKRWNHSTNRRIFGRSKAATFASCGLCVMASCLMSWILLMMTILLCSQFSIQYSTISMLCNTLSQCLQWCTREGGL